MKRYRLENHVANSPTTYNVLGPDGYAVAGMFNRDIPEGARLRAYIEVHDEVMAILREALDVVRDWASTEAYEQIGPKVESLLARIEGKEER